MTKHALLSPSSAHRWLNCPPSARLEATLPAKTSEFAKEGSLAHSVCEVSAKLHFGKIKKAEYTKTIKKLKTDPLWDDEMLRTAETYVEHLAERAMQFNHEPYIAFEVPVDISDYVPEAKGTCDCVMFGENTLIITDYKHGKGVAVSANNNPQLMLYALGALKRYNPLFGNAIKQIEINIDQPRINSYENWVCDTALLLQWGESIKPIAQMAFEGLGEFKSAEWCQFCRANGICKAQAQQRSSAFDDFGNIEEININLLTPDELGVILQRGKMLSDWYKSIQSQALEMLLGGKKIPGYKLVEGRSSRSWTNQDEALETLQKSGVDKAIIYDYIPKTLAQLEKIIGVARFKEMVGKFIHKPPGSPTLAEATDSRKEYNSAAIDFANVEKTDDSAKTDETNIPDLFDPLDDDQLPF